MSPQCGRRDVAAAVWPLLRGRRGVAAAVWRPRHCRRHVAAARWLPPCGGYGVAPRRGRCSVPAAVWPPPCGRRYLAAASWLPWRGRRRVALTEWPRRRRHGTDAAVPRSVSAAGCWLLTCVDRLLAAGPSLLVAVWLLLSACFRFGSCFVLQLDASCLLAAAGCWLLAAGQ